MKKITVIVKDDWMDRIKTVASNLVAAGMAIDFVGELTGAINGSVEDTKMEQLKDVPGALAVEEQMIVQAEMLEPLANNAVAVQPL